MQSSAVHVQLLHHSSPTMSLSTLQASVGSHPMKEVAKYKNTKDAPNPQYAKGQTYSAFLPLIPHVRIQGILKNKKLLNSDPFTSCYTNTAGSQSCCVLG